MSGQRHVIRQQIFEVRLDRQDDVYALQTELSRIYHARIVPQIEQICAHYDVPDMIRRIDSLVLDVGHVNRADLETELRARVAALMSEQIAQALHEPTRSDARSPAQSRAELLVYFARTGMLPWWATEAQQQVGIIAASVRELIDSDQLYPVLQAITSSDIATLRLVRHVDDDTLERLCRTLLPAADYRRLLQIFGEAGRHVGWTHVLQALAASPSLPLYAIYRSVLTRTASATGVPLSALRTRLIEMMPEMLPALAAISSPNAVSMSELDTLLAELPPEMGAQVTGNLQHLSYLPEETAPIVSDDDRRVQVHAAQSLLAELPAKFRAQVMGNLHRLASPSPEALPTVSTGDRRVESNALNALLTELSADLRARLMYILPLSRETARLSAPLSPETAENLLKLLVMLPDDKRNQVMLVLERIEPATAPKLAADDQRLSPKLSEGDARLDLRFSDAEAVYVHNAGLVILWLFLSRWFANLGLVDEGQFVGDEVRQRAIGLLHVLATGQTDFPEFLLPLNKVLCGLPIDALFDFGKPLEDSEMEACDSLLSAVIAQVPLLENTSVGGLRGTFLLRRGALSVEPGGWLLRVERETYDLILDQFPWRWDWVRLPWMDAPLRVEW